MFALRGRRAAQRIHGYVQPAPNKAECALRPRPYPGCADALTACQGWVPQVSEYGLRAGLTSVNLN
jgi:hypothetical protein